MASRLQLQTMLENLLGSRNVYYNPPESIKMKYPAIVYSRGRIDTTHANNAVYSLHNGYSLTYIDEDPDNETVDKIAALPRCRFDRFFVSDNLNHYTFTIYY
jgi:hypothetical protein